jgi:glycosyltransferase involved in cell wall biosynthesis
MRVLVVTVVHTPLDARIHRRQIGAMVQAGWSVTYAAPWSATGTPPAAAGPGVVTHDLPRAVGRRRLAALRAARRLIAEQAPRHDLVVVHDPELLLALGRPARRPPVVFDVHEDLAASLVDRPWIPRAVRGLAARCARLLERRAERRLHLLLAEEAYAERFRRPHPVVRNLPPLPPDPPPPGRDRVVYVGRLSRGRGIEELLELARRLGPAGPRVELVGQPDDDVRAELDAAVAAGTLVWHGWLPNDDAFERLTGALAGLSLLRDLPNYRISLPTKVVEYLAAGLPVVTTPLPAAAALVREADAGIVVGFGDVAAAAAAVQRLRDDPQGAAAMGRRGRELVARDWTWDAEREVFLDALTSAAGSAA